MDRRKFLGSSTKQLVLLNLMGLATTKAMANKNNQETVNENKSIQYRVLGRTGIKIPIVSMGVMNANNPNLIKGAWESGMRHFDTAWDYQNGNNEIMIGNVFNDLNIRRKDFTISTKITLEGASVSNGKQRKKLFLERFDESLSRLRMDYVDILYYHAASEPEQTNDPYIMEAFTELKANKKIRFAGFSTHSYWPDLVIDAVDKNFYDVILLSFNYSMFQDQKVFDTLELAYKAGIGLIAMKTQCHQDWYKRDLPEDQQKYYEEHRMNAALLKWALRYEFITTAIPGFTTYQQLEEDISVAYDLSFTKEEEEFFESKDVKLAIQSVCRHCGKCISSCPNNVDIPSLMRTHMYSLSYGNLLKAKQTLSQIESGKGLDICKDCGECTGKCHFRVPVQNHIHDLKEIYC